MQVELKEETTTDEVGYEEEFFGILTDDNLYIDCTLIKPPNIVDEDLRGVLIWVPKYPLTKSSVMTCAQQEVIAGGVDGKTAHLIFDLRGTGHSDFKDDKFSHDLDGIRLWAEERFGEDLRLGFFGTPTMKAGHVDLMPVRPGVFVEQYVYPPKGKPTNRAIIYLSTYGSFTPKDEELCLELAFKGYHVYGIDPLRYLLHASHKDRVKPQDLWDDLTNLCQTFSGPPIIIGQPVAAGLALMWAAGVDLVTGVIAIGRVQPGFSPKHIFHNDNPHTYFVSRYIKRIAPRPIALVLDKRGRREDLDELSTLYQMSTGPRRFERIPQTDGSALLELIEWIESAPTS